ncbi:chromate transporter [Ruminococcus albus]|uniref:Chromate transporter n=1 Tax=Ruminococcus albus TaxID=1264 RepID=A0A1H7KNG4_RUMAL|nr:chromate transporter [Ruminococcus albus]SEK88074.1 chromate transporter [Ruminococcus albus]
MNKNLDLFLTFMKIGAFTFGGGYAMIPLIQKEVCENQKWLNEKDITDIVAISESTPGPIAINAATFVGYKTSGFVGACLATLGVVLPSFLIISLISLILTQFQSIKAVKYAFMGIRAAVLALILKALWMMFRSVQKKKKKISYVIMGVSLILTAFLKIDAVFVIIGCGLFGLIWSFLNRKEHSNGTD